MLSENDEFALSQYLDGTLPPEQRPAVELMLRDSAEAREALAQYRRLGSLVAAATPPLPELDWKSLSQQTISHVQQQQALAAASLASPARGWWAAARLPLMAAAVLLSLVATWVVVMLADRAEQPISVAVDPRVRGEAIAQVQVLTPDEVVAGPVITEISIGPAPVAQMATVWQRYPELLNAPSSVSIAGGIRIIARDELAFY
jgi:anti-sigma factor RsiW